MSELFDFNKAPEEARWLIEDFIPLGHLCVLLAQSGKGKSYLLEALALHVAFGIPFCGMKTNYGDILIIDQDTPIDVFDDRLIKMGKGLGLSPKYKVRCFNMRGYTLSTSTIADKIYELKPRLVIIDSMHSICGKLNPNKTSDMSVLAKLKSQCLTKDTTIIIAHHVTEKTSYSIDDLMDNSAHISGMGSSAIKQQADTEYIMTSLIDDSEGKIKDIYVRPVPKRQAISPKVRVIKMLEPEDGSMLFEFGGYYEPETSEEEQDLLLLLQSTGNEYTIIEALKALGGRYTEGSVRKAFKSLEKKNRVLLVRTKHNLFKYRLPGRDLLIST